MRHHRHAALGGAVLWAGLVVGLARLPHSAPSDLTIFVRGLLTPGPHLPANTARSAASLLLAAALLLLYDAAGRVLLRWIAGRPLDGFRRFTAPLAGYAAASGVLLGAAACGLFHPAFVLAATGLAAAALRRPIRSGWGDARRAVRASWRAAPPRSRAAWSALAIAVLTALVLPEVHPDSMSYHLAFPQHLLQGHRLLGTHVLSNWAYPVLADLPHALPVACGLDPASRMIAPALAACGAMALVQAVAPSLALGFTALLALAALLVPAGREVLITAKNDGPACGYILAAAALLAGVRRSGLGAGGTADSRAAGLYLGAAVAAKFTVLPVAAGLFAAAAWMFPARLRAPLAAAHVAAAAGVVLPWSVKSWMFCGDPFYPLGTAAFPGWFGDPSRNAVVAAAFHAPRGPVEPVRWFPLAGFLLAGIFPAAAGLKAAVAARRVRFGPVAAGLLIGLAGVFVAVRATPNAAHLARYAWPATAAFNALGLAALAGATGDRRRRGRLAWWAAAAVAVYGANVRQPPWWPDPDRPARSGSYLAGGLSADGYRRSCLASYGAVLPAVRAAAPAGHILIIGEIFLWDLPGRPHTSTIEPPFAWIAARESSKPERVAVKFRQAGVRWVLYNSETANWDRWYIPPYPWSAGMLRRYAGYVRRHLSPAAYSGCDRPGFGASWLLAVSARPRAAAPPALFVPGAESAFPVSRSAGDSPAAEDLQRLRTAHALLPGIVAVRSMLGHALLRAGLTAEAYPHIRAAAEAGLITCYESALVNRALAAARLGRLSEARDLLRQIELAHPGWPDAARKVREALAR